MPEDQDGTGTVLIERPFENPHANDPELGPAYADGYREGAFGDHSLDDNPDREPGPVRSAFILGFEDGLIRFAAFRKGFKRGITVGLDGLTADPLGPPALGPAHFEDLKAAWLEGREEGLRVARVVLDGFAAKALETADFDQPSGSVHSMWVGVGRMYWREYKGDRAIFLLQPSGEAFAVDAPIYAAYEELGGLRSELGRPIGDTTRVPDGRGKVTEFEKGTMYSTATTGAHEVHGLIRAKWKDLGGPMGELGYPTSNEIFERADRGKVNTFEHGDIYFWDDLGVQVVRSVKVRYRGQNCFAESGEFTPEDETYVVASVIGPKQDATVSVRTPIVENVDAGESFPDVFDVYHGKLAGIGALAVTMMEHDTGNPDEYRKEIEGGVRAAMNGLAAAVAATGVGLTVSGIAVALANAGAGPIANAINDAIDSGDDLIGTAVFPLAPRAVIGLARAPRQRERDIEFHLATPLLRGEGAYKAYFDVVIS
jgi:LGFP repeat